MYIILLFMIGLIAIIYFGENLFYSAKRNLFKDQAAWSGKDIKIKHGKKGEISKSNENKNYLRTIADESKIYLEEQSHMGED